MNLMTDSHIEYRESGAIRGIQSSLESFSTDQTRVEIAQDMTDNHYMKTYWIFVLSVMLHLKIMKMSSTGDLRNFIL